ncbi:hypothetical protein LVY72_23865 [Arthrobacter sp. I2-34]|uniref:Glycosyltransferase n=1 Tax=Arthrobacter hankyongi TaxID=2904801 RepID=A0ABS9LE21_9MICC|nr:hypothetical protein [Arthrobacter hankyongi]MCG2624932.1 hypothetical protein [Arthrobacter hankyongi]
MSTLLPRRRCLWMVIPLAVPVLLAGLVIGYSPAQGTQPAPAVAGAHSHAGHGSEAVPAAQLELRQAMCLLWAQHMEWTRLAVTGFASGSAGFSATAERLLQNQVDIGNAIKPYYGKAAGDQLTKLLKAHITNFVTLFRAAKANDDAGLKSATRAVYANAQEIADFLAQANPKYWPQQAMRDMMKGHIDQTIAYGSDELAGNYTRGIAVYDQAEAHMLMMADALSTGLIKAFPNKFH